MAHAKSEHKVKHAGPVATPAAVKVVFLALLAFGAFTFWNGLKTDPTRSWAAFIQAHFFFFSLGLGGLFFAAVQWITGAMWSAPIRRIAESYTAYLPVALLTFAVIAWAGMHELYPWTHPEHVKGDIVLEGKVAYLNIGFFAIRNIAALLLWGAFAWVMVGNSIKQDAEKDNRRTLKNRVLAPIFLMIFALGFTMASFDQLMSLDPHWFSTIFGVYCFAGLFYITLASLALFTILLKKTGKLEGIVNDNHLHDLGKFMFAFTVFWAYIGFSQFMLIWYANLPEETGYFLKRFHANWYWVSIFLLVGKFMTPFFILLPRDSKRSPGVLVVAGLFMLFAQWVDLLWLIQPEFFKDGPRVGLLEVGVTGGFLGAFLLAVTTFWSRFNIVAVGDPRLAESVHKHHQ